MITLFKIAFKVRGFNNFGDCLATDLGVIRFRGYRFVGGECRKVFSVSRSKKIHNGYGYGVKGLVKRAFKVW